MCATSLLRSGQLQSTLGFVKEAQIQPDPEEEPRGLGWQLVPVLGPHLVLERFRHPLDGDRLLSHKFILCSFHYIYFTDP